MAIPNKKPFLHFHSPQPHQQQPPPINLHCIPSTMTSIRTHTLTSLSSQNRKFRDSGTCNGLICLINDYKCTVENSIVIWNPAIKKTLTLPKPNITHLSDDYNEVSHGLGFDSLTNDYKLVRILSPQDYSVPTPEAEFFSLNRNSWTTVTDIIPKYNIARGGTNAFVNGVLHWIGHEVGRDHNVFRCLIVGFDMRGEVFKEISLPKSMDWWIPNDMTISVYKESSIRVCFHDYCGHKNLEVWVMKEYGNVDSWTKICVLDGQLPVMLGFRNNGEVFLGLHSAILSVHVCNEKYEDVEIKDNTFNLRRVGVRERTCYFHPISYYVESLVLLDNPNALSYPIAPTDANISSDANLRMMQVMMNRWI